MARPYRLNNGHRAWSSRDDAYLKKMWGKPKTEICAFLGRTLTAVEIRASRLGLCSSKRGKPRSAGKFCRRGHPLTDDNVYVCGRNRQCKICRADYAAYRREREAFDASLTWKAYLQRITSTIDLSRDKNELQ